MSEMSPQMLHRLFGDALPIVARIMSTGTQGRNTMPGRQAPPEFRHPREAAYQAELMSHGEFANRIPPTLAEVPLTPGDLTGLLRAARAIPSFKLGPREFLASLVGRKNFHGSHADPRGGRTAPGDESGFFSSAEPSHAEFYANYTGRNTSPGQVYTANQPKNPLDFSTKEDLRKVIHSFERAYDKLDAASPDGLRGADAVGFRRGIRTAREATDAGAFRKADSGLRDATWHHSRITGENLLNKTVRDLGHDAFTTVEVNDMTGLPAKVTVYVDRPGVISHEDVVRRAQSRGEDVPKFNLQRYK